MTYGPGPRQAAVYRSLVSYTVLRFVVFFVLTGVLFAVGIGIVALTGHAVDGHAMRPVVLAAAFVAAPLSMVVSYFALAAQRTVLTAALERWSERVRARTAARAAAEDAYVDRLLAERSSDPPPDGSGG